MKTPKRVIICRIMAVLGAIVFLVIECYVLSIAKFNFEHEQSRYIADELSFQLSIMSAAFQSGDKTTYTKALTDYRAALHDFSKNYYVSKKATDLLHQLQNYSGLLLEDSEYVSQLMEIRVATAAISTAALAAQKDEIDALKVYNIVQNLTNFRDGMAQIETPELKDLAEKLVSMSEELIQVSEKSAACISICSDESLTEKQGAIQNITERYQDDISKLSLAASEKYNPNQLILDLNNYSKL